MDQPIPLTYITGNDLKFQVAVQALQGSRICLARQRLDTPEIQSEQVERVAEWSAAWACQQLGRPVAVTDAGFYIEALNGFPGPFIKYVNQWFSAQDYLNLMQGKNNRRVTARDCLAYCCPGARPVIFCREHPGELALRPGRQNGTLMDQLFIPAGYQVPISEIAAAEMVTYWGRVSVWQDLRRHLESAGEEESRL